MFGSSRSLGPRFPQQFSDFHGANRFSAVTVPTFPARRHAFPRARQQRQPPPQHSRLRPRPDYVQYSTYFTTCETSSLVSCELLLRSIRTQHSPTTHRYWRDFGFCSIPSPSPPPPHETHVWFSVRNVQVHYRPGQCWGRVVVNLHSHCRSCRCCFHIVLFTLTVPILVYRASDEK